MVKLLSKFIIKVSILSSLFILIRSELLFSIPKYDEGRIEILGIQLLQDSEDELRYYYLPQYPKIASKENGDLEFLYMKYVDEKGDNGGLLHALVEFSLPQELIDELEAQLQEEQKGARISGPVPMLQTMDSNQSGLANFQVISSILEDSGGDVSFTESFKTSGHAPLLKGSKTAIAAKLNQKGATLLWESFKGQTSDVSIMVSGYYEARIKAYGAIIHAEVNTLYQHFSKLENKQEKFTRKQLRKVTDELIQNEVLDIDIFDRSTSFEGDNKKLEEMVEIITTQLADLMFNAEAGWSKQPETEVFVEQNQIQGRQEKGWLGKIFGGAESMPYVSDNQFVLKDRKDIRSHKFHLNLNKSVIVKFPFFSSGNIGGSFFDANQTADNKYFKIVNLDDPDFQMRTIDFVLDGNYIGAYNSVLNFITVSFSKKYDNGQNEVTKDLVFDRNKLLNEQTLIQQVKYPRLGLSSIDFTNFDYKVKFSMTGGRGEITVPLEEKWINSTESTISLAPPYLKTTVNIDLDRSKLEAPVTIQFSVTLNGKEERQQLLILRPTDKRNTDEVSLFHDIDSKIKYQVNWNNGVPVPEKELTDAYIFLK